MQKYLLLLLLCLVGTIESQARIKVESTGNRSYILTFTNTTTGTTYDWNSLPSEVKAATSLKIVTEGDYKLSTNDMAQIMGVQSDPVVPYTVSTFRQLKSLDMGDAKLQNNNDLKYMKSAIYSGPGLTQLTYFIFPKTTDIIPTEMFENNTTIQEIIMLEPDNENDPHLTEIPVDAFKGCTSLEAVRIPDGITKIGSGAFSHCAFENISFPNSLVEIGPNAFEYCRNLKSITIPHSVKKIGNSAFQWNSSMTDVYVLGNYVEIEDGAFNQGETYNFEFHQNGDVDYTDWKPTNSSGSGTTHPLILHVPDNETAYSNYINPFLRMLNDPAFDDVNGNNELLDAVENIDNHLDKKPVIDAIARKYGVDVPLDDYGILKRSNWVTMDDADGQIKRFFKKANGLFNQENEVKKSVYGGWRNFMLVVGDVEKKTWHDGRLVESRWYSAVFPFDMTYNQLMTAYGVGTDVREFSYVNQHTNDEGQVIRTVTFLDIPQMEHNDKNKDVYVHKGIPYMIHPGVRSVPVEPQTRATASGAKAPVHRTIAGVDVDAANEEVESGKHLRTITRGLVNGDVKGGREIEGVIYSFNGTYKDSDIPANTFFLGIKGGDISTLGFYVTRVELKGKWSRFTSIVQKSESESSSNAKSMDLGFTNIIEEDFGITTAVENAAVLNSSNNTVVYNLSGQVVRENNASLEGLSKGVYVVNGKKIVVK